MMRIYSLCNSALNKYAVVEQHNKIHSTVLLCERKNIVKQEFYHFDKAKKCAEFFVSNHDIEKYGVDYV